MEDKHIKRLYLLGVVNFLLVLVVLLLILLTVPTPQPVVDVGLNDANYNPANQNVGADFLQFEEDEMSVQNVESLDEDGNPIIIRQELE